MTRPSRFPREGRVVSDDIGERTQRTVLKGFHSPLRATHDRRGLRHGQVLHESQRDNLAVIVLQHVHGLLEQSGEVLGDGERFRMVGRVFSGAVSDLFGYVLEPHARRLEVVGDPVAGDRGEPGSNVDPLPAEARQTAQRAQEHVCGEVLREVAIPDLAMDVGVHLLDVAVVEQRERVAVAALSTGYEVDDLAVERLGAHEPLPLSGRIGSGARAGRDHLLCTSCTTVAAKITTSSASSAIAVPVRTVASSPGGRFRYGKLRYGEYAFSDSK